MATFLAPTWMCLQYSGILVILIPAKQSFESPTSLHPQKFSPRMWQLRSPSRNPRQEHASYLWPLFSHQNNYVFWLTITFPTVFCLVVCDVLRWPKCMRDITLVVQNIIMHA